MLIAIEVLAAIHSLPNTVYWPFQFQSDESLSLIDSWHWPVPEETFRVCVEVL